MAFISWGIACSKKRDVKLSQLSEFLEKGWKVISFGYPFGDISSSTVTIAKPKT